MSELQLSAVTMGPPDAAHRSMSLPLRNGATDGSASAESLASSSTSPDSMRSLSSLSGGRTDSPLDSDMPEGNTGRKVTTGEDDSGIQSPDCRPDNDNDNSASVYLDADEDGWCETRDDQDNITRVRTHKQGQNDQEHSDVHSNGNHGRRSSDDSSTTEALLCCSGCEEDEDDEEEEDSFLSLSSADVVMRCQNEAEEGQMQSSSRRPNVSPVNEFQVESLQESEEWARTQSSSKRSDVGPVNELHQTALLESVDIPTEQSQLQSSSRRPSVGPVNELQVESLQESKQRAQDAELIQEV
ncbi:uncharacterized protein [Salminus brasiliensis]|uniref:uncharacterized protein n=1 Tax=Salminus brasiliensis TaxID=930266 RepID=UPI003B82CD68